MPTQTEAELRPAPEPSRNGTPPAAAEPAPAETRGERLGRKARRTRFHAYASLTVALLVCLVALAAANTRQVELSWVVGSSSASLVWIILCSASLGWLLGIVSSALIRWRTRAPRA
jgi:uncharacterized integral membrane protein